MEEEVKRMKAIMSISILKPMVVVVVMVMGAVVVVVAVRRMILVA